MNSMVKSGRVATVIQFSIHHGVSVAQYSSESGACHAPRAVIYSSTYGTSTALYGYSSTRHPNWTLTYVFVDILVTIGLPNHILSVCREDQKRQEEAEAL